jgi:pentatricopeptide repeat protein
MGYSELEQRANNLRRQKEYTKAIEIYEKIWNENPSGYSGAGIINCYRNTDTNIATAYKIAEIIKENDFFDNDWAKNEYILFHIKYKLNKETIKKSFNKSVNQGLILLNLTDDPIKINSICIPILSVAKDLKKWFVIKRFLPKVCINELSEITYTQNEWSQKSLYYNIYFKWLLTENKTETIINQIDQYIDEFPRLSLYFKSHKARAYAKQREYEKALKIYKEIEAKNTPTFILFEIGLIYYRINKYEDALKYLCKAAMSKNKLENKLKVFLILAEIFEKKESYQYAYVHYDLYIHIKQKNNFKIHKQTYNKYVLIRDNVESGTYKSSYKSALYECNKIWNNYNETSLKRNNQFKGKLSMNPNKPYGFINTLEGESFFVSRNNLSSDIINGCIVCFEIKPKFNKKKNKESWEAINVRKRGVK